MENSEYNPTVNRSDQIAAFLAIDVVPLRASRAAFCIEKAITVKRAAVIFCGGITPVSARFPQASLKVRHSNGCICPGEGLVRQNAEFRVAIDAIVSHRKLFQKPDHGLNAVQPLRQERAGLHDKNISRQY